MPIPSSQMSSIQNAKMLLIKKKNRPKVSIIVNNFYVIDAKEIGWPLLNLDESKRKIIIN